MPPVSPMATRTSPLKVYLTVVVFLTAAVGVQICVLMVNLRWRSAVLGSYRKEVRTGNGSRVTDSITRSTGASGARSPPEADVAESHPWCSGTTKFHLWRSANETARPEVVPSPTPNGQSGKNKTYFLTASLVVRVYADDINKFTSNELVQWLQYMSYAGTEHVYVYDSYFHKNESQKEVLRCFVKSGYVTYIDWNKHAVNNQRRRQGTFTQKPAYMDTFRRLGHEFSWVTAIDIDEYPFCPSDRAPGFLARFLRRILAENKSTKENRTLGEIYMNNYLFTGPPPNVTAHPLLIDRFLIRTKEMWNRNVKPISHSKAVSSPFVHRNTLYPGYTRHYASTDLIRMFHYHGARHLNNPVVLAQLNNTVMTEERGMSTAHTELELCRNFCPLGCCG